MLKKFAILLFPGLLCIVTYEAPGQSVRKATIINSDKGLSQNSVYSICKDSKGFLWIGTGDGLNRFDGKECKNFRNSINRRNSLNGFYISYKMAEDNRHCLWFSTERSLVAYDQVSETFSEITPYRNHRQEIGNKTLVEIDTLNACVWFISPMSTLYCYNYVQKTFEFFDFPKNTSNNLAFQNPYGVPDKKGNIWITSDAGLFRFNKAGKQWTHFLPERNISDICIDENGIIWLLNKSAICSFDPESNVVRTFKNPPGFLESYIAFTTDHNGNVYAAGLTGNVFKISKDKGNIEFITNIVEVTGYDGTLEIRCLYADSTHLLWIGTEGAGAIQLDLNPSNFQKFPSGPSGSNNALFIKSLYPDADGVLWMGTFKNGIYLLDTKTHQVKRFPIPEIDKVPSKQNTVYAITRDAEGIYWIGYDGVLVAYNKRKNAFYFHRIPLKKAESFSVINHIRVQKDYLLVSTTSGLFKVTTSGAGKSAAFSTVLNASASESLVTADGSLWVSSLYQGLLKVDTENQRWKEMIPGKSGARCILEDKEHHLIWVATQTGLVAYHIPSGRYKYYDEESGLINTYLYGIIKTRNEIWISSNNGIAKGVLRYEANQPFPQLHFKCYSEQDGLQSQEFNTGAYAQSGDSIIYFGGIQGVNWFWPGRLTIDPYKPSIVISELKINDKVYDRDPAASYLNSITLPYSENTLSIKFIGLEFTNPESVSYQFRLKGLEQNWTKGKASGEVRYAALPAGEYVFSVFAITKDYIASDEKQLTIIIKPPYYKTLWFRVLIGAVTLMLIIFLTKKISQIKLKNKIRALEKEKALIEERQRISKEMHDELGAGLTQISLISESAKTRSKKGVLPQKELNDIAETSKVLIESVSEIIWAMNPDFDTFSGMIAYLREQLSKLLEYSGKAFEIQFPEINNDFPISNTRRKNILMLIKEAVNNAIKHSNARKINVALALHTETLEITVADNGDGFNPEECKTGNGLKNYRYRTELLHGTFNISSNESGTTLSFHIPINS